MKELLRMLGYSNIHFTIMPVFRWDGEDIVNQTQYIYPSNGQTSSITYGVDNTQTMMGILGATTSSISGVYTTYDYPQNMDEAYYTTIHIGSLGNDLAEILATLGERTIVFLVDYNNNIQRDVNGHIMATYID